MKPTTLLKSSKTKLTYALVISFRLKVISKENCLEVLDQIQYPKVNSQLHYQLNKTLKTFIG